MTGPWLERFEEYFRRPVAEKAAGSLANGVLIGFTIPGETAFTFTRIDGKNSVKAGDSGQVEVRFILTPAAAESILSAPSEQIDEIGVGILKLIASSDRAMKVSVKVEAGFLTLFTKGYFGVIKTGGSVLASYLASKGLGGVGAIKAALQRIRGSS